MRRTPLARVSFLIRGRLPILEKRFGRRYARQRLQIEKDHEAQVFGNSTAAISMSVISPSVVLVASRSARILTPYRAASDCQRPHRGDEVISSS
jgi:hypothetical protein